MYIKRVKLTNIRCFEKLEIDFDRPGSSILFLGDNGDGKSTVLKSIAMGLCDESSASALFRELPGEFVRRIKNREEVMTGEFGTIEIDLGIRQRTTHRIVTTITSLKTFEQVKQKLYLIRDGKPEPLEQDEFPWDQIFVSGYGAGIRVQGSADFQHYLAVDAVYPLFKYDEPLQNPELVIRRLVEAARGITGGLRVKSEHAEKVLKRVKRLLASFLDLKKSDRVILTETSIKVRGPWGIAELGELGDGYRATVTWVLDLLAWWFLKSELKPRMEIKQIKGIVLFDEIEQHLHPRWQRYILSYFKRAFPKVQFIATTHSPLCAAGTADLGDEACQLISLVRTNGAIRAHRIPLPSGLRADQVLTSSAFNLTETRNPLGVGDKVVQYRELVLKRTRSKREQRKLNELRKFVLQNVPEAGQFEEERQLRNELRGLIGQLEKEMKKRSGK